MSASPRIKTINNQAAPVRYAPLPEDIVQRCTASIIILFFTMLTATSATAQRPDYQQVAADWLYAARTGVPADSLQQILYAADKASLKAALNNDNLRKTFWINVYNAATQTTLKAAPEQYKSRNKFFKAALITIAGEKLSLDKVEHGILRRSKNKLSFGYLNKWFPGRFEKDFRVDRLDKRIHFALNCGARSCPPIAYYTANKIDEQLQSAMTGHLKTETDYDSLKNTAAVTAFMGWFRGDLGGKRGVRKLLHETGTIPAIASPRITFKKYDWNLYLDNFRE